MKILFFFFFFKWRGSAGFARNWRPRAKTKPVNKCKIAGDRQQVSRRRKKVCVRGQYGLWIAVFNSGVAVACVVITLRGSGVSRKQG